MPVITLYPRSNGVLVVYARILLHLYRHTAQHPTDIYSLQSTVTDTETVGMLCSNLYQSFGQKRNGHTPFGVTLTGGEFVALGKQALNHNIPI